MNYVPNMNYYSTTFQPSSHNYAPLRPTNPGVSVTRSTPLQHPVPPPVSPLGPTPTILTTSSTPHAHPPQSDSVGLHQVHPPPAGSQLEQQSVIQLISNCLTLPKPEQLKFNGDPMDYLFYFIYIIHISIYGIHVTKQVKLKIQLEY